MNVRQTLTTMQTGENNAILIPMGEVRGTYLRNVACLLKEIGMSFHVNKVNDFYKVWREN